MQHETTQHPAAGNYHVPPPDRPAPIPPAINSKLSVELMHLIAATNQLTGQGKGEAMQPPQCSATKNQGQAIL